jgi:hypothetical protein
VPTPTALNNAYLSIIQPKICTTIWSSARNKVISAKEAHANKMKNQRSLIDHASGGGQHLPSLAASITLMGRNNIFYSVIVNLIHFFFKKERTYQVKLISSGAGEVVTCKQYSSLIDTYF